MDFTLRRLWVFWRCRTNWDGRFCHVDWIVCWNMSDGDFDEETSADLLCDDLSILSRSPGPLHRHRPLSRIYSPCRWVTTLMRTESGRLNLIFMRGSLMWIRAGMSQMSLSSHVWSRRVCPFDFCQMSRSDDDTLTLLQVRFDAQRDEQFRVQNRKVIYDHYLRYNQDISCVVADFSFLSYLCFLWNDVAQNFSVASVEDAVMDAVPLCSYTHGHRRNNASHLSRLCHWWEDFIYRNCLVWETM